MFRAGDSANTFYMIVKGEVEIAHPIGADKQLRIHVLKDGDLLVWSAIVPSHCTKAMRTTLTETMLLGIDAQKLREIFEVDAVLAYVSVNNVATMLGEHLEIARQRFATMFENLEQVLDRSRSEGEQQLAKSV